MKSIESITRNAMQCNQDEQIKCCEQLKKKLLPFDFRTRDRLKEISTGDWWLLSDKMTLLENYLSSIVSIDGGRDRERERAAFHYFSLNVCSIPAAETFA